MIPIASPTIGREEKDRVLEVLNSGQLTAGQEVGDFESAFASYSGTSHALATSNGTTALHAACEALDLDHTDTVLTTPFSFIASANAAQLAGCNVVFGDIDPETYNLDPESARGIVRERAKNPTMKDVSALIVVHLYGLPAEMKRFQELAVEFDLDIIEDAAQAHGSTYDGLQVGSIGDVGCFSFYPSKNMTTSEGGMITTDRESVATRARSFINHGRNDEGVHERLGHNYRMTDLEAAIGGVQLSKLDDFISSRQANASALTSGLADLPPETPVEPVHREHVYHQYTIRVPDRADLKETLEREGIGYGVYYRTPIPETPAYREGTGTSPIASAASEEVLSLPVHPAVDERDVERTIEVIRNHYT